MRERGEKGMNLGRWVGGREGQEELRKGKLQSEYRV